MKKNKEGKALIFNLTQDETLICKTSHFLKVILGFIDK
jgi:hypothetical protein